MAEDLSPSCKTPEAWVGCYKGNWDYLTPASMSHPAKMAPALAHRILDHLEELGWLKPGMRILDFMAGTGLTGLMAGSRGYGSTLVELEERFAKMIGQNREALEKKLGHPIDMEIIQGDARNLSQLLKGEQGDEVSVSHTPDGSGWDRRMAGNQPTHPSVAITSPPYSTAQEGGGISARKRGEGSYHLTTNLPGNIYQPAEHGSTPGQIGNLKDEPIGIVSPPYGDQVNKDGQRLASKPDVHWQEWERGKGYGSTPGQIGSLPDSSVIGITSPPYEDSRLDPLQPTYSNPVTPLYQGFQPSGYGTADGQIGQEKTESYLQAMKTCYAEAFKVCPVLVVVIKDPTRNGKIRELGKDTVSLLEQVGYQIHCIHKAILFEEQEQGHLFEGSQKKVKGRMSFFKRLAYRKGSPVARWEWVIFAGQPGNGPVALVSPPYQSGELKSEDTQEEFEARLKRISAGGSQWHRPHPTGNMAQSGYGAAPGQIGRLK